MKIEVKYAMKDIDLENWDSEKLDKIIMDALKQVGFKWYASGLEIETGIRDIAFDAPEGD